MRTLLASGRRAVAVALTWGGLWQAPIFAQEMAPPRRSIYDRSSQTVPAEPRRLPEQGTQQSPGRTRRAQGYLSQGSMSAGAAPRSLSTGRPEVVRAAPTPTSLAGGVVPAFFPAPIAGNEPPSAGEAGVSPSQQIAMLFNNAAPGEHKLLPAVRWAKLCMDNMAKIQDYSAKMVKRERIDGTLSDYEYLYVKVRHQPFSVYLSFIGPARVKGQEAIYVAGQNNGNLLGHANGMRKIFGTVSLKPDSMLAMAGNRYPITELGIRRLTERLIEVGEHDAQFGECDVTAIPNTKINGRECVCLQVFHPVPRKEFLFHKAKIYVDSQLNLPVRYEAYDWPTEQGGQPQLLEEYTYLDLKINNGFTDRDFDVTNPAYQFK